MGYTDWFLLAVHIAKSTLVFAGIGRDCLLSHGAFSSGVTRALGRSRWGVVGEVALFTTMFGLVVWVQHIHGKMSQLGSPVGEAHLTEAEISSVYSGWDEFWAREMMVLGLPQACLYDNLAGCNSQLSPVSWGSWVGHRLSCYWFDAWFPGDSRALKLSHFLLTTYGFDQASTAALYGLSIRDSGWESWLHALKECVEALLSMTEPSTFTNYSKGGMQLCGHAVEEKPT